MARSHPVHTPADEVARITLIKPQADSAEAASQDRVLVGKFSALKALNRVGVKNNFWKMWDNMQGLHVMDLASNAEVEEELFRRKKQKREAWFDDAGNVICVAITTPEGIQTESVEASLKERVLAGTIIAPRALNRVGVKNNRWKMWEAYKGLHVTDLAINQFAITFQDTDIPDAEGNLVPPSP